MSTYTVQESVRHSRLEPVRSYADLEHHHPSRNLAEPGRLYADVGGRSEEILKDRATGGPRTSAAGDYFVSKDFILTADGRGDVAVPAPVAGYAGAYNRTMGSVELWSGPASDTDRVMLARVLHMDPDTFKHKEGDRVEYGEPLGIQAGRGIDRQGVVRNDAYGTHVHIDINTRYIGQFDRYLGDLGAGLITTETRPAPSENIVDPPPVVTNVRDAQGNTVSPADPLADGVLARGEKGGAIGALQSQLRSLGYTNARGEPVVVDKDFGPGTEHAIKQFQTDKALPVTGVADEATRQAIDRAALEALRDLPPMPGQAPQRQAPSSNPAQRVEDALYAPLREQVYAVDRAMGRTPDEASDRVAAALCADCRANGLTRVDGVVLGQKGGSAQPGEYVFAYSGSSERPSDWVGVKTAEAVQTPVEQSLAKAETLQRQQALEAQQMAQAPQQVSDAPVRSMG